jgi:enamine deaminase RidA (YjgF/YER057c/UK114 family)
MASPPRVVAERVSLDKPPSPDQRRELGIGPTESVRYRRVRLRCGSLVLSEADNWYVPSRLTKEMNELLDTSDTPFGKVVQGLHFQRRTLSSKLLWLPLLDGWEMRPIAGAGPGGAGTSGATHLGGRHAVQRSGGNLHQPHSRLPSAAPWRLAMTRRLIGSGSTFEAEIGYSRAVIDGDWIFVSGTTGFDYATMSLAEGVVAQAEKALQNIEAALLEAGASLADVVRVTYILPDAEEFPACWPVLRQYFGDVRPAATMISAGLVDKRLRIEIEVTARIRAPADRLAK